MFQDEVIEEGDSSYTIVTLAGKGAFGNVYRARDNAGRDVAIKVSSTFYSRSPTSAAKPAGCSSKKSRF